MMVLVVRGEVSSFFFLFAGSLLFHGIAVANAIKR